MQLVVYTGCRHAGRTEKTSGLSGRPAGIFYYNVKDPMLQKEMEEDLDELDPEIFKKLKMNGLVMDDRDVIENLDSDYDLIAIVFYDKGNTSKRFFLWQVRQNLNFWMLM